MRPVLGIVSLLVVLAVVGFIAKKQLGTASAAVDATTSGATTQRQAQQIQQQIKATVEGVMQQPRPMPEEK
jgi:parvulin-like peptidyl-prolyl isomerase